MNTSRLDRRQKQKDKAQRAYGSQKHVRIQEEQRRRKRAKRKVTTK